MGIEKLIPKERRAIEDLLNREVVRYTEHINVCVDQDRALLRKGAPCITLYTEQGHVVRASFSDCLGRIGGMPHELNYLTQLKELYLSSTASYMLLVELSRCPSLESLYLRGIPNVKFMEGPYNQVNKLSIVNCDFQEIEELNYMPNLNYLKLSDNNLRDISDMPKLKNLEYLDLSFNKIPCFEGLEDFEHLETLDIRNNGLLRRIPFYFENRKVIKKLKEKKVKVKI